MYDQLVFPNLKTLGKIGWCLKFVEDAYNSPHLYATATDAWNSTEVRHTDRNFPAVAVPVWFSYYENGLNFGHVAIYVPNQGVLSSPYARDNTQVWFKDVDECARVLHCSYLGWSEDIANLKVVEKEDVYRMNDEDAKDLWRGLLHREPENDDVWRAWVGKTFSEAYQAFASSDEWLTQNHILKVAFPLVSEQVADLTKKLVDTQVAIPAAIQNAQKSAPAATNTPTIKKMIDAIKAKLGIK